jgi:hypothetical protein
MKRLTCRDLGGPCDAEFAADSFEEIGKKSQEHVKEQMQKATRRTFPLQAAREAQRPSNPKATTSYVRRTRPTDRFLHGRNGATVDDILSSGD